MLLRYFCTNVLHSPAGSLLRDYYHEIIVWRARHRLQRMKRSLKATKLFNTDRQTLKSKIGLPLPIPIHVGTVAANFIDEVWWWRVLRAQGRYGHWLKDIRGREMAVWFKCMYKKRHKKNNGRGIPRQVGYISFDHCIIVASEGICCYQIKTGHPVSLCLDYLLWRGSQMMCNVCGV